MAPLASPAQLQKSLLQAVRQFMNQSQVFTDRLELHLQMGVSEYLVEPPKCQFIVSIRGVFVNGEPTSYWSRDGHEDVVCFVDDMSDCDCAVVEYAWAVQREDCAIPDKIWDDPDYWWTVQNGALRIMHRMFGSTIVSQQRAFDADLEWRNGVANAKSRKVMNFSNSRPRMHRSRNRGRGFGWR
jgi:hypothetical protein